MDSARDGLGEPGGSEEGVKDTGASEYLCLLPGVCGEAYCISEARSA
jgi:hypothetical protein